MALYALLTSDLTAVQTYPLTKTMVRRKAVMGSLVKMTSAATDITSIDPRIVQVQPTSKPPVSEQHTIVELDPVKNGSGIWQQTWDTVPLSPADRTEKLNALKKAKWGQVVKKGEQLRTGKFTIGTGEFDLSGDGFTRIVLMGVVPGARTIPIGPNATGIERYFDADASQVSALVSSVSGFMDAIAARESALRDRIATATTYAELEAINIESGWPRNA